MWLIYLNLNYYIDDIVGDVAIKFVGDLKRSKYVNTEALCCLLMPTGLQARLAQPEKH